MSPTASSPRAGTSSGKGLILKSPRWVAPLCWIAVLLDGFDAVVLGAVMPALLEDKAFDMTTGEGTAVATAGLFGMMVGALAMGWLTDRLGRRKMLIGAVVIFSVLTFAAAFAPTVLWFGTLRFLAGLGLGGCLPTGISMVNEFARKGRGSNATTVMMTGYHVGAVLTAALAIWVLTQFSWHTMFIAGALPAVILVPLMYFFLPESPSYLAAKGDDDAARAVAAHYNVELELPNTANATRGAGADRAASSTAAGEKTKPAKQGAALLLSGTYARNSTFIWIASFMGLLLVYGLNTWLPQIMRAADYDLGNALGFLLILNVGAVVGLWIGGRVADRITPRVAGILWFAASAVLLAALAIKLPVLGIYIMVFLTGCFVFSSQVLVYAFTAANHPPQVRATALGMSAGVGRLGAISGPILGGTLLTAGLAYPWGFFAFALVGALGGASMLGTKTVDPVDTRVVIDPEEPPAR
ncbi:aromatic acid/H+ symport family MFS transporter [Kocuria sp. cx-116]|uniref:MFS transporter n=1 Tax=Kocuria sp. cx-116 TaxID=2771378 RepID=UPI001687C11C|nr:aromatic acid/H+ symport family MFS transporter [Kocuria sp. cx-116]MBD2762658.1 aromatic acid/H+ symport family MFS transporter [Kocuria sp. cx-116]